MTIIARRIRTLALATTLCAPLFAVAGCGGSAAVSADAEVAADSTDTADAISALTSVSSEGVDAQASGATSASIATAAATGAAGRLFPASCVVKNVVGNVATLTMTSCTGPYGLLNINGTLTATYMLTGSGAGATLKVDLAGTAIKVNGATLNVATSATLSGTANSRSASVTSTTQATTARGNVITHAGMYNSTWDGMCLTLSGSFATKAGANSYATTITDYKKCLNACPTQGSVTFVGVANTLTITYSGGRSAKLVVNGGAAQDVNLLCNG